VLGIEQIFLKGAGVLKVWNSCHAHRAGPRQFCTHGKLQYLRFC